MESLPTIPTLSLRNPVTVALIVIALFAGVWRVWGIEREGLNQDEIVQAKIARGSTSNDAKLSRGASYLPPASLLKPMPWAWLVGRAANQQQPPLDYMLQRISNQFSARDGAQRALACFFGTIAVFLTGWLGWLVASARVGILSALFLALCPLQIDMSRTARPYTITQAIWIGVLLIAYWAYRVNTRRGWIYFSAAAFLLLTARGDLPLFALAALGVGFLMLRCRNGFIALCVAGVVYLPLLGLLLYAGRNYLGSREPLWRNVHMLLRGVLEAAGPAPYLLLPLAIWGGWAMRRQRLAVWYMGLCGITVSLHMAFWFVRVGSPLFSRYLVHYTTPLMILAAAGFWSATSTLSRFRYAIPAVAAALLTVLVVLSLQREKLPTKEGWREAALLATEKNVDQVWMFKTGTFVEVTKSGDARVGWLPDFYGDWYRPIPYSSPLSGDRRAPKGKVAIAVWEEDFYDPSTEPLQEAADFEHFHLTRLHFYVPRGSCDARCLLDGAMKIRSRQPDFPAFQQAAMDLDWYRNSVAQ